MRTYEPVGSIFIITILPPRCFPRSPPFLCVSLGLVSLPSILFQYFSVLFLQKVNWKKKLNKNNKTKEKRKIIFPLNLNSELNVILFPAKLSNDYMRFSTKILTYKKYHIHAVKVHHGPTPTAGAFCKPSFRKPTKPW